MTLRLTPEQFAAAQARAKRTPAAKAKPTRADLPAHAPRPNKFKARKTGGYASAKEARRAQELKLLRDAGKIMGLEEQIAYEIIPAQYVNGKLTERACKYVVDFVYVDIESDELIFEDVKGYKKGPAYALFSIKRKLMLQVHGIAIRET